MRTRRRLGALGLVVLSAVAVACGTSAAGPRQRSSASAAAVPQGDWTTYDYNRQRSGVGPADTGIDASNLERLKRVTVRLDGAGVVDSSAVELTGVEVEGKVQTIFIMTTQYGRTLALNANSGKVLWEYWPSADKRLVGSPQFTTSTPIVDPDLQFVYATSPDGYVQKLRVSDGHELWRTRLTYDPTHEKLAGSLNIEGSQVIAETDGYDGDIPPYQGHVVTMNRSNGRITHVWNSLCSNVHHLIDPPSSCHYSDSAIWGRPGAVIEPDGDLLVTTGNGDFNGRTNWGDSVLELSPTLKLLHNWTPTNQQQLNEDDWDLGSTEPALLPVAGGRRFAVQGGKEDLIRLLNLKRLDGTTGRAGPRTGGQIQTVQGPGPVGTNIDGQPAVWSIGGGKAYVYYSDPAGTAAYLYGSNHRLKLAWEDSTPGNSPVIAGGLLYVYDEIDGYLNVRNLRTGKLYRALPAAGGHWNTPIVIGGRILLPVGDDNAHSADGTIYIYHLPGV